MNPRIKEILDDMAILSQALYSEQENVESLSILGKIKLLSAQLYLESDMELITSNMVEDEKVMEVATDESVDDLPIFSFDIDEKESENPVVGNIPEIVTVPVPEVEPIIAEPIAPVVDVENLNLTPKIEEISSKDLHISQNFEEPHIHISQTTINITPPAPVETFIEEEITLEHAQEIANEVIEEAVKPVSTPDNLAMANAIISKFSLTRRYEFMNFLFGGDMNRFAVFISEILNAPNEVAREDVFGKWHDENQWSRKYETASDLKRNLNKILQG